MLPTGDGPLKSAQVELRSICVGKDINCRGGELFDNAHFSTKCMCGAIRRNLGDRVHGVGRAPDSHPGVRQEPFFRKCLVKGSKVTASVWKSGQVRFDISTDKSKFPKTIDFLPAGSKLPLRGIYVVDGNIALLAIANTAAGMRPARFNSAMEAGTIVFVFRRSSFAKPQSKELP